MHRRQRANPASPCRPIWLLTAMLLAAGPAAQAQEPVSGETAENFGIFEVPTETCQTLRGLAGTGTGVGEGGDVILACDATDVEGQRGGCRVILGGIENADGDVPIGFCEDSFPNGVSVVEPDDPSIKDGIAILASTFGEVLGFRETGASEGFTPANLVCATFTPGGEKACRNVVENAACTGEALCMPPQTCDVGPNLFLTPANPQNSAAACAAVQGLIAATTTGPPGPELAFVLFTNAVADVPGTVVLGRPGSQTLFVCPGQELQCFDPASDFGGAASIDYQFSFRATQDEPDGYCVRSRCLRGTR